MLTVIGGNIFNDITNNLSTQLWYQCEATSKQFSNVDDIFKIKVSEDQLQFGMSTLNAYIRCCEWFLHLAYKLDVQKWQARAPVEKKKTEIAKQNIQK